MIKRRAIIFAILDGGPSWWPLSLLGDIILGAWFMGSIVAANWTAAALILGILGIGFCTVGARQRLEADMLKRRQPTGLDSY